VSVSPRENVEWNYVKRRYPTLCAGAGLPFCLRRAEHLFLFFFFFFFAFAFATAQRLQTHWPMRVTVIPIDFSPRKSPERAIGWVVALFSLFRYRHVPRRIGTLAPAKRKIRVITLCSTWEATESRRAVFQRLELLYLHDWRTHRRETEREGAINPQSRMKVRTAALRPICPDARTY